MRPRTFMAISLSLGVLAAAAAAVAQQQQPSARQNFAAARQAAAQPAPAPARKAPVTSPSLLDRFAGLLKQQPAAPVAPAADPGAPQALPVNWAVAGRYAQAGSGQRGNRFTASFVARNRAAIDSLSVPVLLPSDPDLAAGLRLFPHGDFYTISANVNGMSFVMTGHSKAYPLPPGVARGLGKGGLAGRIPADGIVIEGNESGLDADFSRFGAVYSIALDCANRGADVRCGSEAYVRGVIARMTVVTPAGRG
jgi:hypothetical protein